MSWISVKDRLPEIPIDNSCSEMVIISYGMETKVVVTARYNEYKNIGKWMYNSYWEFDNQELITHWMPLPEPPTEE